MIPQNYFTTAIGKKDGSNITYKTVIEEDLKKLGVIIYWIPSKHGFFIFFTNILFVNLIDITKYFEYDINELIITETQYIKNTKVNGKT